MLLHRDGWVYRKHPGGRRCYRLDLRIVWRPVTSRCFPLTPRLSMVERPAAFMFH